MDIKSIIFQNEDSLPTLKQNISTVSVETSAFPTLTADAAIYWKTGGSVVMGLAGMLYLGYGKKNADVQKMMIGAALTVGSFFLF